MVLKDRPASAVSLIRRRFDVKIYENAKDSIERGHRHFVGLAGMQYVEHANCAANVCAAAKWLHNGRPWLLLQGSVGTGKTTTLRTLCAYVQWLYADQLLKNVLPLHSPVIKTTALSIAEGSADVQSLQHAPFVAIDDFGAEPSFYNDFGVQRSFVQQALFQRFELRLPTVISTNNNYAFIKEKYGERLYDRMKCAADVLVFNYDSFRERGYDATP